MTKNSLILLVVLLAVGFAIWFSRFGKELKKTQEIVTEQQADTRKILRRQTAAVNRGAPTPAEVMRTQLQQELEALSQQAIQEQQKLDLLEQQREDLLRNRVPQTDLNYTSQLQNTRFQIQALNESLQSMQWDESALQRRATEVQTEQDANLQLYLVQMDQNIRALEAGIIDSKNGLEYWTLNDGGYYNLQRERLQYFENLLAEQTRQLEEMKVQRIQIAAQAVQQTQGVQNQVRQIASEADAERASIQDEITFLRQDMARLEYSRRQALLERVSAQSQIQKLDRNIQGQQEAVRTIQNLMREKQTELNSVR